MNKFNVFSDCFMCFQVFTSVVAAVFLLFEALHILNIVIQVNYVSMRPIIRTHSGDAVNYMKNNTPNPYTFYLFIYLFQREKKQDRLMCECGHTIVATNSKKFIYTQTCNFTRPLSDISLFLFIRIRHYSVEPPTT